MFLQGPQVKDSSRIYLDQTENLRLSFQFIKASFKPKRLTHTTNSSMELRKTPLFEEFLKSEARLVPFAGWEMPIQFSGLIKEHHAVRNQAGVFDISHMGVVELAGMNTKNILQGLVPSDLYRIGPDEACYTVLLNQSGGIIDDLIIYDLGVNDEGIEKLILIINAASTNTDQEWLASHFASKNISITDKKENQLLLALQGPFASKHLQSLTSQPITNIPRFGHRWIKLDKLNRNFSEKVFISRTGYTGEDGFEILIHENLGKNLWKELQNQGVTPCGLGARDTLRLEAGMHLYGNDMNIETTPFEAGLGWLVHLEMCNDFIGRSSLEKQAEEGIKKRLVGIELPEKAIARSGYKIFCENVQIGQITSGTWSPTLKKGIALGYVSKQFAKTGTQLDVEIRGKSHKANVVKLPFYHRKKSPVPTT